jgi:hypothetical protein
MRGLRNLAVDHLIQCVDAPPLVVQGVHQMPNMVSQFISSPGSSHIVNVFAPLGRGRDPVESEAENCWWWLSSAAHCTVRELSHRAQGPPSQIGNQLY